MGDYYELDGDTSEEVRRQINTSRSFQKLYGVYRGIVEKTSDNFKLGYIRVRIPTIHSESLSAEQLPLGYVSQPFGGGVNYGSFLVPPKGSTVFVMFENGDPEYPIILGTWYGDVYDANGNVTDTEVPKSVNNCLISHDQDEGKATIDVQRATAEIEPYNSTDSVLTDFRQEPRNFILKSPKGHAIEIDDTGIADTGAPEDGQSQTHNEGIRFTTRIGQVIHIIDEPGQESILIKNADVKNDDGSVTPGNYIQIDQKTKNINVFSNQHVQEEITTNRTTHVGNDENTVIENNQVQLIKVDKNDTILNNWNVNVGGNINITCQGSVILTAIGPVLVNAGGNASMVCNGSVDAKIDGSMSAAVTGPVTIDAATINLN